MLNIEQGIHSLTNFKGQTAAHLERLPKTGEPVVLTVNGKAQLIVQDAAAYQKLVEAAAKTDREETIAAIREGLADVQAGRTKPARTALNATPATRRIHCGGIKARHERGAMGALAQYQQRGSDFF